MNSVSVLQSEKTLVDVTGIEPVTPCLQNRFKLILKVVDFCCS
jgi:hypothetical protein